MRQMRLWTLSGKMVCEALATLTVCLCEVAVMHCCGCSVHLCSLHFLLVRRVHHSLFASLWFCFLIY